MRHRYERLDDPAQWAAFLPVHAQREPYRDPGSWPAEPAGAERAAGLRRLSRLTWRAGQLGALAAVGFMTVFARTAPAQTLGSQAPVSGARSAAASATRSAKAAARPASKTRRPDTRHAHRHRVARPAVPASAPAAPASAPATPAPAPTHTLAPPTTAPAPPPSHAPTPKPTMSTHSVSGG